MSNQDQAAEVIRTWQKRHKNVMDSNPDWAAQNLAHDLHQAGVLAPDDMDWQEADYRPPRFYTLYETTEKGPNLGDHVTRAKRLVGPWEEA